MIRWLLRCFGVVVTDVSAEEAAREILAHTGEVRVTFQPVILVIDKNDREVG